MVIRVIVTVHMDVEKLQRHNDKRQRLGIQTQTAVEIVENLVASALVHHSVIDRHTMVSEPVESVAT